MLISFWDDAIFMFGVWAQQKPQSVLLAQSGFERHPRCSWGSGCLSFMLDDDQKGE